MTTATYTDRYIAFLDVLGFRALIELSGADVDQRAGILRRVSEAISWSKEELHEHTDHLNGIVLTQFSDSFVISASANSDSRYALLSFCMCISNVIHCFFGSNLLIRGGVTRGLLVHNEDSLFGPAMNRAYDLESKMAKVPRVVLDNAIPLIHTELADAFPFPISIDDDEFAFVDYFNPGSQFYLIPERWFAIQQTIEAIPRTPELMAKRSWMVRKYNQAIGTFSAAAFEERMREYADMTDNIAVYADRDIFIQCARNISPLEE